MICKCGGVANIIPVIECGVARWKAQCCICQKETQSWMLENSAKEEWKRMQRNFPTCDTCKHYDRSEYDHEQVSEYCNYNKTHTKPTYTCPEYLKEDVTIFNKKDKEMLQSDTYTHEQIKTLLESDSVPYKHIIDYHAEYLKLEKDYFEDVADLKRDLEEATRRYDEMTRCANDWADWGRTLAKEKGNLLKQLDDTKQQLESWRRGMQVSFRGYDEEQLLIIIEHYEKFGGPRW